MKKNQINIYLTLRVLIGCLFVVSGFEKLVGPYQNFLYVVQSYEFLSSLLENCVARAVPWIELFLGAFLILGLWTRFVLRALGVLVLMFLGVVAQALLRHLPIEECGCFGELFSFPPHVVLMFDSTLLVLIILLSKKINRTRSVSLDNYFDET